MGITLLGVEQEGAIKRQYSSADLSEYVQLVNQAASIKDAANPVLAIVVPESEAKTHANRFRKVAEEQKIGLSIQVVPVDGKPDQSKVRIQVRDRRTYRPRAPLTPEQLEERKRRREERKREKEAAAKAAEKKPSNRLRV